MSTLPGVAAIPVILGPALIAGGALGLMRDAQAAALLGDVSALLAGLAVVVVVVAYVIRPTSHRKDERRG